jgi:hypothetical protein
VVGRVSACSCPPASGVDSTPVGSCSRACVDRRACTCCCCCVMRQAGREPNGYRESEIYKLAQKGMETLRLAMREARQAGESRVAGVQSAQSRGPEQRPCGGGRVSCVRVTCGLTVPAWHRHIKHTPQAPWRGCRPWRRPATTSSAPLWRMQTTRCLQTVAPAAPVPLRVRLRATLPSPWQQRRPTAMMTPQTETFHPH